MQVFWAAAAAADRADIFEHISKDDSQAAIRMDERFAEAAARLAMHPHLGKVGLITGTRELIPHPSYRMVYELDDDVVWILALVHTAQLWPHRRPD